MYHFSRVSRYLNITIGLVPLVACTITQTKLGMKDAETLIDSYNKNLTSQNYSTDYRQDIDIVMVVNEEDEKKKMSFMKDESVISTLKELLYKLPKKTAMRKKLAVASEERVYFIADNQVTGHFIIFNKAFIQAEDTGFFSDSSDKKIEEEIIGFIYAHSD